MSKQKSGQHSRRFTQILSDLQADGRGHSTPESRRPSLAHSEHVHDDSDLFTDSSSSDDEEVGSTTTRIDRSIKEAVDADAIKLTASFDDERQALLSKIATLEDILKEEVAAKSSFEQERHALFETISKLEDSLEEANDREEEIEMMLDTRAVTVIEHDVSDESDNDDRNDDRGDRNGNRNGNRNGDVNRHHHNHAAHASSATTTQAAVEQERQRLLEQHSLHITTIEEEHSNAINTMQKQMDDYACKQDRQTSAVLKRLQEKEEMAIKSNQRLQQVVEEVEKQVNEERERHNKKMRSIAEQRKEIEVQEQQDKQRLAVEHESALTQVQIEHENVVAMIKFEHTMNMQNLQQQHDTNTCQTYSEWSQQHEQELDTLRRRLDVMEETHESAMEVSTNIAARAIKKLTERHARETTKRVEERTQLQEIHYTALKKEQEKYQMASERLQEMSRKQQQDEKSIQSVSEKQQRTIKEHKEKVQLLLKETVQNQSAHEQSVKDLKLEHLRVQAQHENELASQTAKAKKLQKEIDLQRAAHAKRLEEVFQANQTRKDEHAREIALLERKTVSDRLQMLHNLRQQHELDKTTSEERMTLENTKERAARVLQRWLRERICQRQTTATFLELFARMSALQKEVMKAELKVEKIATRKDELSATCSMLEEKHAIALDEAYDALGSEVDQRVHEISDLIKDEHDLKISELKNIHEAVQQKIQTEAETKRSDMQMEHVEQISQLNIQHQTMIAIIHQKTTEQIQNIENTLEKKVVSDKEDLEMQHAEALKKTKESHRKNVLELEKNLELQVLESQQHLSHALENCREDVRKEIVEEEQALIATHQKEVHKLKQLLDNARWSRRSEKQALVQKLTSEHTVKINGIMQQVQQQLDSQQAHLERKHSTMLTRHAKEISHIKEDLHKKYKHEILTHEKKYQQAMDKHRDSIGKLMTAHRIKTKTWESEQQQMSSLHKQKLQQWEAECATSKQRLSLMKENHNTLLSSKTNVDGKLLEIEKEKKIMRETLENMKQEIKKLHINSGNTVNSSNVLGEAKDATELNRVTKAKIIQIEKRELEAQIVTLQEELGTKERSHREFERDAARKLVRVQQKFDLAVLEERAKWEEKDLSDHRQLKAVSNQNEMQHGHQNEIATLKNQHIKKIKALKNQQTTAQNRSNSKMEQLSKDMKNEQKEILENIQNKYENELQALKEETEHLELEAAENLELTVLRITTNHNQVVSKMEEDSEKILQAIHKERSDFESFMIEIRKEHLQELDKVRNELTSEHREQMENMSLQLQKNVAKSSTDRSAILSSKLRNTEVELESLQRTIAMLIVGKTSMKAQLEEQETKLELTAEELREAKKKITVFDRTLHQTVEKSIAKHRSQRLKRERAMSTSKHYSPSNFAEKKRVAKERAQRLKNDRALSASKHLTFSPKLIPRRIGGSSTSTSSSGSSSSGRSSGRSSSSSSSSSATIEAVHFSRRNESAEISPKATAVESEVWKSATPNKLTILTLGKTDRKPFVSAVRRNTYFGESPIEEEQTSSVFKKLSPKSNTTLDVQWALLKGSKINMACSLLRRKLRSRCYGNHQSTFLKNNMNDKNRIDCETFVTMIRNDGNISHKTMQDEDIQCVFNKLLESDDESSTTLETGKLREWLCK
jgi:hypothetical protein